MRPVGVAPEPEPPSAPAAPVAPAPAGPRPASVTEDEARTAERVVGHFEAFAAAVEGESDCAQVATEVKKVWIEAKDDVARAEVYRNRSAGDPAAREWFKTTFEGRMMIAMKKMSVGARRCGSNPEFREAMKALPFRGGR